MFCRIGGFCPVRPFVRLYVCPYLRPYLRPYVRTYFRLPLGRTLLQRRRKRNSATLHCGSDQPRIRTKVLSHLLVCSLIFLHCSLICLLHTARSSLHCAHSFSRSFILSLTHFANIQATGKVYNLMSQYHLVLNHSASPRRSVNMKRSYLPQLVPVFFSLFFCFSLSPSLSLSFSLSLLSFKIMQLFISIEKKLRPYPRYS